MIEVVSFLQYIVSGAIVGFIVGLTGIGGGALMTPLLIMFGYSAPVAVGTDLMYAALTKLGGGITHHRQKHVNWSIVSLLMLGSLPAALLTGFLLNNLLEDVKNYESLMKNLLGLMLLLTSGVIFYRYKIQKLTRRSIISSVADKKSATVIVGVLLGILVTLTSVGAGAIGTAVLMLLYPTLRSVEVVGTDIVHAVPLTLIAGLVYMYFGYVDFLLLGVLLIGSLPAIHLGSRIAHRFPEGLLKSMLASLLFLLGMKYAFF